MTIRRPLRVETNSPARNINRGAPPETGAVAAGRVGEVEASRTNNSDTEEEMEVREEWGDGVAAVAAWDEEEDGGDAAAGGAVECTTTRSLPVSSKEMTPLRKWEKQCPLTVRQCQLLSKVAAMASSMQSTIGLLAMKRNRAGRWTCC